MNIMLNKSLILRLARYFRVLQKLKTLGFVKVFSNNLGDAIGVTPAVVRKDFSMISLPGNKRGGYNIDTLIEQLSGVLGRDKTHEVVVVGCGKIGTALMQYREFQKEGIRIAAGFDTAPERTAPDNPVPVYDIGELGNFVAERQIQIGIIAVPDTAASQVLDLMITAGIKGVLNFAPVELKGNGRCIIQNVNIGLEIENLFYLMNTAENMQLGLRIEDGEL